MKLIPIALCLCLFPIAAQDAKIIIVERRDTSELKKAYADFKAARDAWEKVKIEVAKKYTVENGKKMDGWDEVEFSVDFRALVPAHRYSSSIIWNNGGFIPTSSTLTANASGTITASSDPSVSSDLSVRDVKGSDQ